MQTEWVRAFVLLKEKMNFTEAAEEMFVSPSSFSKYIKALESDLGITLIDRSRHRVCLTPEGEAIYPHALKLVEDWRSMRQSAQYLAGGERGELHISVSAAANTSVYIRHILAFFEEHPQLKLSLHEYDIRDARKAFQDGELDMVIGYTGVFSDLLDSPASKELSLLVLRQEELFYAGILPENGPGFPEEAALSEECAPAFTQLAPGGEPVMITLSQAVSDRLILHQNTYTEVLGLLDSSGVDLHSAHPIVTTASMDVLKAYLLSGTARSLLSASALRALGLENRIRMIPIREHPTLCLGLLCRTGMLSGPGRKLFDYLREMCGAGTLYR